MHQRSIASLLLAGANVLSLARAQASSESADASNLFSGDTCPGTACGFGGSVTATATATATSVPVVTQTVTSSATSSQTPQSGSPNDVDASEDDGSLDSQQLYSACFPGILNNQTDWTAPCPAMQAIQGQCEWGPDALDAVKRIINSQGSDTESIDETWEMQPPELQRACLCSSQYEDMVLGCGACLAGYGLRQSTARRLGITSNATIMSEWSKQYCDASKTPTEDSFSEAFEIISGGDSEDASGSSSAASTTSSLISRSTAVSIYFTPSVSSAYIVALPTASSSANQTHPNAWYTYSSLSTSDGQIVPTAIAAKATGGGGGDGSKSGDATASGSSTTTAAAGAMQTAMMGAGAIGAAVFALAL
jgi:hypothetical protein